MIDVCNTNALFLKFFLPFWAQHLDQKYESSNYITSDLETSCARTSLVKLSEKMIADESWDECTGVNYIVPLLW